jgi:hypothetical protein
MLSYQPPELVIAQAQRVGGAALVVIVFQQGALQQRLLYLLHVLAKGQGA